MVIQCWRSNPRIGRIDFRLDTCRLAATPRVNFAILLPQFPQQLDLPPTTHDHQGFLRTESLRRYVGQKDHPVSQPQPELACALDFPSTLSLLQGVLVPFGSTCLYSFVLRRLVDHVASLHASLLPIEMDRNQATWQPIFETCLDPDVNNLLISMLVQVGDHVHFHALFLIELQVGSGRREPEIVRLSSCPHTFECKVLRIAYKEAPFREMLFSGGSLMLGLSASSDPGTAHASMTQFPTHF